MAEQRLIDANLLLKEADKSLCENPHTGVMAQAMHTHEHKHFMCMVIHQPTIDPETLPIVQQLRKQIKELEDQKNKLALANIMENMTLKVSLQATEREIEKIKTAREKNNANQKD